MTTTTPPSIEEQFGLHRQKRDRGFGYTLLLSLLIALAIGLFFRTVRILRQEPVLTWQELRTSFNLPEEKKSTPLPEKPKPLPPKKEVYDLTTNPVLNAPVDVPKENTTKKAPPTYGVETVYTKGLGSGGSMQDALVDKRGNTTDKAYDTLTAPNSKVLGVVTAAVTVTRAPGFKKRVTPTITPEIKKSGVSGVIKVKVLVDVDGKVKKAMTTDDLGYGTKEEALKACLQMEFSPAMRETEAVAVWITIPVRFEKLG